MIKKASGFKEYNATFWINERSVHGCKYQCKQCGRIKLGLANNGHDLSHHMTTCPKYPALKAAAEERAREVVTQAAERKLEGLADRLAELQLLGHMLPSNQPLSIRISVNRSIRVYEQGGSEPLATIDVSGMITLGDPS